ncbi:MAG TPA: hypothetical protein VF369_06645 [candidate division Zixibacteria bacterium]
MEKILKEIKSVQGVTGTLVLAKGLKVSYYELPTNFTPSLIKQVGAKLQKLCEKMSLPSRLDLKFDNGIGMVYNLENSVILIFGKPDMDFSFLGLVLKSALQSIERLLEREEGVEEQTTDMPSVAMDQASLNLLIEAINLVATGYAEKRGIWWVTRNLRKSKEDIIREFPQMSNFYVNNQGKVSLVSAKAEVYDRKIPLAVIKWIDLFVNKTPHSSPRDRVDDVKKLTAHISQPLEGLGFYELYTKVAKKTV